MEEKIIDRKVTLGFTVYSREADQVKALAARAGYKTVSSFLAEWVREKLEESNKNKEVK